MRNAPVSRPKRKSSPYPPPPKARVQTPAVCGATTRGSTSSTQNNVEKSSASPSALTQPQTPARYSTLNHLGAWWIVREDWEEEMNRQQQLRVGTPDSALRLSDYCNTSKQPPQSRHPNSSPAHFTGLSLFLLFFFEHALITTKPGEVRKHKRLLNA